MRFYWEGPTWHPACTLPGAKEIAMSARFDIDPAHSLGNEVQLERLRARIARRPGRWRRRMRPRRARRDTLEEPERQAA